MSKYPIKINGEDFTDLFHKRGYVTYRTPVYGGTYTDLDQVDHYVVSRWRGGLSGTTNDLTAVDAARLSAALMALPGEVTYYSFQLKQEITETMAPLQIPAALKLQTSRASWIKGVTLSLEQT